MELSLLLAARRAAPACWPRCQQPVWGWARGARTDVLASGSWWKSPWLSRTLEAVERPWGRRNVRSQERKHPTWGPGNPTFNAVFFLLMQHAKARPCHLSPSGMCLQYDPVPSCGCPSCLAHLFLVKSSYTHQPFPGEPVLIKGVWGDMKFLAMSLRLYLPCSLQEEGRPQVS